MFWACHHANNFGSAWAWHSLCCLHHMAAGAWLLQQTPGDWSWTGYMLALSATAGFLT